jgi:hypothetical protein
VPLIRYDVNSLPNVNAIDIIKEEIKTLTEFSKVPNSVTRGKYRFAIKVLNNMLARLTPSNKA